MSGGCIYTADVHVYLHVLLTIQDRDAHVLFINPKADELRESTHDLLVSSFLNISYYLSLISQQSNILINRIFTLIRMVARYAAPISYNFLNLIRLGDTKTIFEKVFICILKLIIL